MAVAYTSRDVIGDRSAQQGAWWWYIQSIRALVVGWGRWQGISMTPRRLYTVVLRIFVIHPSTVVELTTVDNISRRSACDLRPHYPIRITSSTGRDGHSYVWSQTDTQKTWKSSISFQRPQIRRAECWIGRFPWHPSRYNTSCYVSPSFFLDHPRFDGGWKWVKTVFVALIESPYTTLYQTVRTCHDISSDEVT